MKFIFIAVFIIIIFIMFDNKKEHFGQPLQRRMHVVLNKDGCVISESPQQPSGQGIPNCAQVDCPSGFSDNLICWCCCNYD